jgi:hypothetical protein
LRDVEKGGNRLTDTTLLLSIAYFGDDSSTSHFNGRPIKSDPIKRRDVSVRADRSQRNELKSAATSLQMTSTPRPSLGPEGAVASK